MFHFLKEAIASFSSSWIRPCWYIKFTDKIKSEISQIRKLAGKVAGG